MILDITVKEKLELNLLLKKSLSVINCSDQTSAIYSYLKPQQSICIRRCVEQHQDILAVLATGAGKTLVFLVIPVYDLLYCRYIKHGQQASQHQQSTESSITLVISPLNAIISQHQKVFGGSAFILKEGSES